MFCKWLSVFLVFYGVGFAIGLPFYFHFFYLISKVPVVDGLSVSHWTSNVKYCKKLRIETGNISKLQQPNQGGKTAKGHQRACVFKKLENPAPGGGIQLVHHVQRKNKLTIRSTSSCKRYCPGWGSGTFELLLVNKGLSFNIEYITCIDVINSNWKIWLCAMLNIGIDIL